MPMRSKAQRAFLHANEPEVAKKFEKETPKGKRLPKKVSEDAGTTKTSTKPREFLPDDPDRGYMSEPDDSVLKTFGEAHVDGKHISDDEEAILEPAAVNEQPPIEEGQYDQRYRAVAEDAFRVFLNSFQDEKVVKGGNVEFHGPYPDAGAVEMSWELDEEELKKHGELASVLRGLELAFLFHKDPADRRAAGYFHRQQGSQPNKIVIIPDVKNWDFTKLMKFALTRPRQLLGLKAHHRVFVHEFTHYMDFLRHKNPGKFGASVSRPEYGSYGKVYHNDPHEMNAFYQQAAADVERVAARLGGKWNKVWEDPKTFFVDAVIPHLHPGHWDQLSTQNKKRILKRSYQLWQDLKKRHPTKEASRYPPGRPPKEGGMRPAPLLNIDEAGAVDGDVVKQFQDKLIARSIRVTGERLGFGSQATVFPVEKDRVLKVTEDRSDALAMNVTKSKGLKHVAKVFDVFRFPSVGEAERWGIVMERLTPIPKKQASALSEAFVGCFLTDLTNTEVPMGDWKSTLRRLREFQTKNPKDKRDFDGSLALLEKFQIPDIVDELHANGIDCRDFHPDNIMVRSDGSYAMIDLGFSTVRSAEEPPVLERVVIPRRSLLEVADVGDAAEKHTGTFFALKVPPEVAQKIAVPGGEAPEKLHVTLFYKKGLTDEQRKSASTVFVDACKKLAGGGVPVKLGGIGRFSASPGSDGKDVIYASVDSPSLQSIRQSMAMQWNEEGIDPDVEHAFVPHVTLAYVDADAPSPVHRLDPVQFKSTRAVVKEAVTREDVFVVKTTQPLKKKVVVGLAKKDKKNGLVGKFVAKIPHLDELDEASFASVVRSLRDGTASVTEKVDGSAHVTFGLDGGGLWVRSKHGPAVRSPDDHVGPGSGALRWAHRTLENISEGLSKAWPLEALCATADVLDGPRPNVLPYFKTGLAVHGLYDRRGARLECQELLSFSSVLFEAPRVDGRKLVKFLAGPRPTVQEALVRHVAGVRSSLGSGPVEGVVVRTPDGVVTKVVDRGFFTALNSALWGPREALDRGEVREGHRIPGVLEDFRRSVVRLSGVSALGSHHIVDRVRSAGPGDVDTMFENWSRSSGAFVRGGSLDEAKSLARAAIADVDRLWSSVSGRLADGFDVSLTRADGSRHVERVDLSHPVAERTAVAFDTARSWLAALAESKTVARFVREFVGPVRLARIREDVNGPPPSSPSQVIERYRQLLSKKGLEPNLKRSLGSGYHGEAYELAAHGKVLKVTDDEDEARAAQHVKGKTLRHVVKVFDVFSFPGATWFGVVVEKLRELPEQTKEVLTRLNGKSMNSGGLTSYDQFMSGVSPDDRTELEKMKFREMYDELAQNKILYSDWHGGNVMTRTGQEFVLADLGGETVSPGKTPPVIEKRVTEGGKTGSIGVTVGRFQPFHRGHGELVRQLAKKFDRVVVIVGGSKGGERNPFSWKTRLDLMKRSLPDVWGKVIVRPATYEGRPSGFVPGVLSDMSKEKGSPIKSDTSFQVLVGPDRVDDVRRQFEQAPEGLNIDTSLVSVEEMPEVESPSGKSVSGTDVRAALKAGDEARLKELLDPQLVSNEHDFHEVVKKMKSEMGIREDISKTATAAPKNQGGFARVGGDAGIMASLNAHAEQLMQSPWHIDVKSLRRLGSGMDGVAFDIGGNKVLKVTGDLPEAFSANSLIGKPARHVVKIFDVFRFPRAGSGRMKEASPHVPGERRLGLFGIVEEKLTPLSDKEKNELNLAVTELDREVNFFSRIRILRPWKDIVEEMRAIAAAGHNVAKPVGPLDASSSEPRTVALGTVAQRDPAAASANKERGKNVRIEGVEQNLKTLDKFDIGLMHDELLNYGIEFSDFHGGNVMKRGGDYVINDLGRSGGTDRRPPRNLEHVMREEIRRLVEQVDQEAAVDAVLRNGDGLKALLGTDATSVVETVRDRDGQSYFFVKGKELRVSDDEFAAFVLPLVGKKGVALVNVFHAFSLDEGLSAALIERGLEPLSVDDEKELTSVIAFLDRATKGAFSRDFGKKAWKEIVGPASKELARYTLAMAAKSTKDADAPPRAQRKISGVRDVQDTSHAVVASIARFNLPRMSEELRAAGLSVTLRSTSLRIRPDGSVLFFYGADKAAPGVRLPTLKALNSSIGKRIRGEGAAFTVGSAHVGLRAGSSSWSSPRGSASPRAKSRRTVP